MAYHRRPMRSAPQLVAAALLVLIGVCAAAPAQAQQRYDLTGDGWEAVDAPGPDSPAGKLQAARKLLAEGKAKQAYKAVDRWIDTYPNNAQSVEAFLLRADATSAAGDPYLALRDYEFVIRRYPASQHFHTALEREYEIARMYVNGKKRKFLGLEILPATADSEELLIRIQERAPGSEVGERAHLLLGDYYFESGQMISAAEAYDLFLENYPQSDHAEFAMLRVVQANLARYKGPSYDQRGLIEAQQRLRQYAQRYPAAAEQIGADALIVRIRESLARRDLITADWYTQRGLPVSAATLYRRVIRDYPDTAAAAEAVDRLEEIGRPVVLVDRAAEADARDDAAGEASTEDDADGQESAPESTDP